MSTEVRQRLSSLDNRERELPVKKRKLLNKTLANVEISLEAVQERLQSKEEEMKQAYQKSLDHCITSKRKIESAVSVAVAEAKVQWDHLYTTRKDNADLEEKQRRQQQVILIATLTSSESKEEELVTIRGELKEAKAHVEAVEQKLAAKALESSENTNKSKKIILHNKLLGIALKRFV